MKKKYIFAMNIFIHKYIICVIFPNRNSSYACGNYWLLYV